MPKYKVMATQYMYKDALIEAEDIDEVIAKAETDGVEWITVGGDFEIHEDMIFEEKQDD